MLKHYSHTLSYKPCKITISHQTLYQSYTRKLFIQMIFQGKIMHLKGKTLRKFRVCWERTNNKLNVIPQVGSEESGVYATVLLTTVMRLDLFTANLEAVFLLI